MKRRVITLSLSLVLLSFVFMLGILLGSAKISFFDAVRALFGVDNGENAVIIITSLRLPRTVGAIFAGAALAVSGLLLQTSTGNDLTAPNIVGINSGAGFFVMLLLCFFPAISYLLSLAAFIGAVAAALLVIGISSGVERHSSRTALLLSGVAVGALFGAGISFLSLLYPDVLASYTRFSVGGLSGVYFDDIAIPVLIISLFLIVAFTITPRLNLLMLGDDMAASMGVRVLRLRYFAVIVSAVLASAAVSYIGLVGFVGLIVPHLCRRLVGVDNRILLPTSAILGGVLVTLADILSRVLFAPTELPCGILTSALGAPFFLFLLLAKREDAR